MHRYSMVAAAACLLAGAAPAQGAWRWNAPPAQPVEGVEHGTYHSESMDVTVGYNVLLPDGYTDTDRRYPVVYWLHGLGGNENSGARLAGRIRTLTAGHSITPMLFVFVNGGASSMYSDSSDGSIKSETTIITELIPHIDRNYRTIAGREGRAIEGFSMGGYGALMLGTKHPELFCSVLSYAGALHDADTLSSGRRAIFDRMFGSVEAFSDFSPYRWTRANAERIRDTLPLRIVVGTDDQTLGYNQNYQQVLRQLEIPHVYHVVNGIDHNIARYYDAVGLEGLRFLAKHFRVDSDR